MLSVETKLNDIIPVLGLGTWNMKGSACINGVQDAINSGYRHIDTAQMYGNEEEVGKGLKSGKAGREEIFITTKVATGNLTASGIRSSVDKSLKKLGSEYVDLLLIHWPTSSMDLQECLETMFELRDKNKVRYVGVSNFDGDLFREAVKIGPVVNNQVKFNPYQAPFKTLDAVKETGTTLTAYTPLEQGKVNRDSELAEVAKKYGKTPSQLVLRWLIQLGSVAVIPKASSEKHRRENMEIFDFEISDEEMKRLNEKAGG